MDLSGPNWMLLIGETRDRMRGLPERHFHMVVTSPPYWGLRDYGLPPSVWGGDPECEHEWGDPIPQHNPSKHADRGNNGKHGYTPLETVTPTNRGGFCQKCNAWLGCLGLEPTPELFVANMVLVFRDVWRILRDDGTLWLNLGDCYANDTKWGGQSGEKNYTSAAGNYGGQRLKRQTGLKPKDLVGIPWRVAFALQADGWYLRDDIIWHKPNPMPSSVTDRTTKSHEYLFLLTKKPRYFYDVDAIREPCESDGGSSFGKVERAGEADAAGGHARRCERSDRERYIAQGRNKRSVWRIPTAPFKAAHFATFPPRLVRPCILAGTSERGCCPHCGAPWKRITERMPTGETMKAPDGWDTGEGGHGTVHRNGRQKGEAGIPITVPVTTGWAPSCKCGETKTIPCRVFDPFAGSGTTIREAIDLGREGYGTELNQEYAAIAEQRITAPARPAKQKRPKVAVVPPEQRSLFV